MKLLIVDDEKDVQWLFEKKFRKEQKSGEFDMYFAYSGEEALELLKQPKMADVKLVLTDINMPGMNGLDLLKVIKEQYSRLPVIVITAYDDAKNRMTAYRYGANDYINKPIDFEKLKDKILRFSKYTK
jgi:DNA-binding NtrC family response regulator